MKKSRAERRAEFLALHPICYFCGEPATTFDHVPHRDLFKDRVWPEEYEFPACERCNDSGRKVEQIVALYTRLANFSEDADTVDLQARLTAVMNNSPEFLPSEMRANDKRRAMRERGMLKPRGMFLDEIPMMSMPPNYRAPFDLFARRLTCALYYKHMGSVMPLSHTIRTEFFQTASPGVEELVQNLMPSMPGRPEIRRQRTDLGDQFYYIWFQDDTLKQFAFAAGFADSYLFIGASWPPDETEGDPLYIPHSEDIATLPSD